MTPPIVKKLADTKASVIQPILYKSVVTIYRVFAILTLYVVLAGVRPQPADRTFAVLQSGRERGFP